MSVHIKGTQITLTRGDTLKLQLSMTLNGSAYTPEAGEVVLFAVKHAQLDRNKSAYLDASPVISKTVPNDTLLIVLAPADTKGLGFGPYDWDIQITRSDGTVDTFLAGTLILTKEVS